MTPLQPLEYVAETPVVAEAPSRRLLFVDMDGTLIASDLLWESLVLAVKNRPLDAFKFPGWLLRGRAHLKRELAQRVSIDVAGLPWQEEVIDFLREERAKGTKLILATASDGVLANQVADELNLFDDRLCNDGIHNLKGRAKLAAIESYCQAEGVTEFAYIGDARADMPIWSRARQVYAVAPNPALLRSLQSLDKPVQVFGKHRATWRPMLRALRPHQWVKNLLLVIPLILSHELLDVDKLIALLIAFGAFSACASAIYLINDLSDLGADRRHPTKSRRPFAAGTLPLIYGPCLVVGLLSLVFGLCLLLPPKFGGFLLLYLALNYLYTTWLKRKVMADVLLLAGLYTLRLLAGGAAVEVPLTEWLLAFSTFLFLSLAFVKRYSELSRLARSNGTEARGRGYRVSDLGLIQNLGSSSGYLAVLILALYINTPRVRDLYPNSAPLWLLCPLLLYWISRLWFCANRNQVEEDPVVFAIKDRVSLGVGSLVLLLLALAVWW
jgi:4-hydroxybenzoate polyprenyltransferase/phosphoserine phosphatase